MAHDLHTQRARPAGETTPATSEDETGAETSSASFTNQGTIPPVVARAGTAAQTPSERAYGTPNQPAGDSNAPELTNGVFQRNRESIFLHTGYDLAHVAEILPLGTPIEVYAADMESAHLGAIGARHAFGLVGHNGKLPGVTTHDTLAVIENVGDGLRFRVIFASEFGAMLHSKSGDAVYLGTRSLASYHATKGFNILTNNCLQSLNSILDKPVGTPGLTPNSLLGKDAWFSGGKR